MKRLSTLSHRVQEGYCALLFQLKQRAQKLRNMNFSISAFFHSFMKIRTLISIAIITALVISSVTITLFIVKTIHDKGNADIESFRTEELEKVKSHIKSLVDVVYETVQTNHRNSIDKEFLVNSYGQRLKDSISFCETILIEKQRQVESGELSLEEAQNSAREAIRRMHYGKNGYLWINDTTHPDPIMILEPIDTNLEGHVLDDPYYNYIAEGKNVFNTFVNVAEQEGEGFVRYLWKKPTPDGLTKEFVPKLSYLSYFKEWDLIVGTGIYVDSAIKTAMDRALSTLRAMRYNNQTGYFWVHEMTSPYPTMIMHPTLPEIEGTILNDSAYNTVQGTDENFFVVMDSLCKKNGEGFVEYMWPKPMGNGVTQPQKKLSFVKLYRPLNWVVGSGVYIDDIDKQIAEKKAENPDIDVDFLRAIEIEKIKRSLKNLTTVAFETIKSNYENSMSKEYLIKHYGTELKDVVVIAKNLLKENYRQAVAGILSIDEAKRTTFDEIRKIRFGDDGYIWVTDTTKPYPITLVQPVAPNLENRPLNDPRFNFGAEGKNLFRTILELVETKGNGFVEYLWPQPQEQGKSKEFVPKLSYVHLFKPWNWVLGTGIYIDDAVDDAIEHIFAEVGAMRYDNGVGYFWFDDTSRPIPKTIMHPVLPELIGTVQDGPEFHTAMGINQNIFVSLLELCDKYGGGFADFIWPKPTSSGDLTPDIQKLAYVKLYEPLGWMLATGVYIDDIDAAVAAKRSDINNNIAILIKRIVTSAVILTILALTAAFFFARTLTRPINKLIHTIHDVDIEKMSALQVEVEGTEEIADLGTIFNEMLRSLYDSIEDLEKTTAAKEHIESELSIAHEIQMGIIPRLFPAFPNRKEFDVYAILESAKGVGGNLYDFFFVDDNKLCFAIGNVSEKGVPAALFMAVTQTLLKARADKKLSAGEIIEKMNDTLSSGNDLSISVSYFLCILDTSTGIIQYCNAGHHSPYVVRNNGTIEEITGVSGIPIGTLQNQSYTSETLQLNEGDSIFLYTAGITDAINSANEPYGSMRLEEQLKTIPIMSTCQQVIETILTDIRAFSSGAEQSDDITMVALKYNGVKNNEDQQQ